MKLRRSLAAIVIIGVIELCGSAAFAASHSPLSSAASTRISAPIRCASLTLSGVADGTAVIASVTLGDVKATLSGSATNEKVVGVPALAGATLSVLVDGRQVLSAPVPIDQGAIGEGFIPGGFGQETAPTPWSWVLSTENTTNPLCIGLFGGRTPETAVLVNEYTGGAHCCTVIDAYPVRPTTMSPSPVQDNLGNPDASLAASDGRAVILTADNAFAYEFASYGGSGLPLLTLELRDEKFVATTRQHSEWAALDAAFEWGSFIQSQPGYGLGWLAAWAADECTLGQTQRVLNMLNQLETQGLLDSTLTGWPSGSAYVSQLEAFLSAHGYGSAR